jgi:N-formylglutamate deformylase
LNDTYSLVRGNSPLLVSVPHTGTVLPASLRERLVPRAAAVEDTDWHLERLYAFAIDMGASLIVPRYSRFVVDLNRPREDTPMYAGVNNTGLVPTRFFTGDPLYREGQEPGAADIEECIGRYWQPYHDALDNELMRLRSVHGHAVLFDAHSIKSTLPWLFEGTLPALNLGTVSGRSCAASLAAQLSRVLSGQQRFSHVVDGRFKGGYITRRYGRPHENLHAVQLEMCWRCYLDEARPHEWDEARASEVRPLLRALLQSMLDWRP